MRIMSFIFAAALAVVGCDTNMNGPDTTTDGADVGSDVDTGVAPSKPVDATDAPAPDNTGVNERDQDGTTKTPTDQKENEVDVERTAEIRRRITDTEDLSVNARNVKIITADGKVTLRGPVASQSEKDAIAKIAEDVAGAENVDNQLEIAP